MNGPYLPQAQRTLITISIMAAAIMNQVDTTIAKPGSPGTVVISVDGAEYARLELPQTVALAFTASETFDVGTDLGSPVSKLYYDRRPFAFTGKINSVTVTLK